MAESVSVPYTRGLLELALSKGADRHALPEAAGIDVATLADPDARVPLRSYASLMRAAIAAMALDYLTSRKVSVNETAYLVGFSEPAAFSRAFKRWTGKRPRDVGAAS